MKKVFTFLTLCFFASALAAQTVTVTNATLTNGTYNWTADTEYILDGAVFLEAGGVLNIEAGTVIRGKATPSNSNDVASVLVIARGAMINAAGSANNPIIMTAELDDLDDSTDLGQDDNQLWGGLIVLGNAPVGEDGGTDQIEGLDPDNPLSTYGGTNIADNSGTIRYLSLRHGGADIGADNEINGLTLGGVGNGTTIDHVEIFANKDDGFEFFGGSVNATYLIAAFCGDDSFDFDESWSGYLQFIFSIHGQTNDAFGDNAIEYDGSEDGNDGIDDAVTGRVYNATFIGANGVVNTNSDGVRLKSAGALELWNSIIYQPSGYAFRVEDASLELLAAGNSAFASNITFGGGTYVQDDESTVIAALAAGGNVQTDPGLASISRTTDGGLDPRPAGFTSIAYAGAASHSGEAENTPYRGAFRYGAPGEKTWAHGWTALDSYGYLYQDQGATTGTADLNTVTATVSPNPAAALTVFTFELNAASQVSVQMTDLTGRIVYAENLGQRSAGVQTVTLNVADLAVGTYIINAATDEGNAVRKFVKK